MMRIDGSFIFMNRFALFFIISFSSAALLEATDISVSSSDDTNTSGTLRYALNNYTSGDTITFSFPWNITLTASLPAITQNVNIHGDGGL